jgi:hypothetical protein
VNGVGVIPDIEAEMNPAEYETPGDGALLRAVEELLK